MNSKFKVTTSILFNEFDASDEIEVPLGLGPKHICKILIFGLLNTGKSTFINQLVGQKLQAVSSKAMRLELK